MQADDDGDMDEEEAAGKSLLTAAASLDESVAQFQTQLYQFLQVVTVPAPMTPSMMAGGSVHEPLRQSYAWPKLTGASFVELVARLCAAPRSHRLVQGVLDRLFTLPELGNYAHVRNRLMALWVQCLLRAGAAGPQWAAEGRLHPALTYTAPASAESAPRVALAQAVFTPTYDITERRGGVFEPALALVLVRSEQMMTDMQRASGRWVDPEDADEPVNLLFMWMEQCGAEDLQVVDNLEYDIDTNTVSVWLPTGAAASSSAPGAPALADAVCSAWRGGHYTHAAVLDVQRYELVSKPVAIAASGLRC